MRLGTKTSENRAIHLVRATSGLAWEDERKYNSEHERKESAPYENRVAAPFERFRLIGVCDGYKPRVAFTDALLCKTHSGPGTCLIHSQQADEERQHDRESRGNRPGSRMDKCEPRHGRCKCGEPDEPT